MMCPDSSRLFLGQIILSSIRHMALECFHLRDWFLWLWSNIKYGDSLVLCQFHCLSFRFHVWICSLARLGSVVLAVHDGSDVFLEIGKLTKYSGLVVVPSISFILFAISWFILRLIIFPFVLIRSARYVLRLNHFYFLMQFLLQLAIQSSLRCGLKWYLYK